MAAPIALCDTKGMTNERWLECRMHGPKGDIPYTVGGSDVATIFGVSPWTTPLELWMIKKGRMKPPVKSNAMQLEMGHLLEPITAHFYGLIPICISTRTILTHLPTLTVGLSVRRTESRGFWNAKAVPITMREIGQTVGIRFTTNCSYGSTLRLPMWNSVRSLLCGETIRIATWHFRSWTATAPRRI